MTDVLSQPAVYALARTLGHFVWQGAAIALVMLVAFRLLRSSAASARYLIGVGGMAAMLIAPVVTLVFLANGSQPAIGSAQTVTGAASSAVIGSAIAPITSGTVAPASQ